MRPLTFLLGLCVFLILFAAGSQFASCTKETTVYDTVIVRDTIIDKDTVTNTDTITVIDSSCASCYDLTDGLIAYYNFNGGNLNDSSGNNNNIVFNNATKTTDRFGNADNAYLFNGSSSYMQVSHSSSLSPTKISIMGVYKPMGYYGGPCYGNNILSKGWPDPQSGFYFLRFQYYVPNLDCYATPDYNKESFSGGFGGGGAVTDTAFAKTNQWYNVVVTYDGTTANLYVNGQLKETNPVSYTPSSNTQDLFIGKHGDPAFPYWFNGVLDEIRIYNRALCEGEVKALYKLKN